MTRSARLTVVLLMLAAGGLFAALALLRFHAFHNETFDLALYARMSWGLLHLSPWDPVTGALVFGVHLAFVQLPLALPGALFGYANALLVAQAALGAAAAWPLARLGARHLGSGGGVLAAAAWLLHPNLAHVLTDEYHPGTVAALPLAFALDALDRRDARALGWSALGVVACREDLALMTLVLGALAWAGATGPGAEGQSAATDVALRRTGRRLMAGSLAYFLLFAFVLVPVFGPREGSADLHFGPWGGSVGGIVHAVLSRPADVIAHVFAPERLRYVGVLLAPTLGLALLAPRALAVAAPALAVNLLSAWPTAIALESHYQTLLALVLVAATVYGAARAASRVPVRLVLVLWAIAVAAAHAWRGGTPLAADWDPRPFVRDAQSAAAARAVAHVPAGASVQAPYALMPHLAEREFMRKAPPPDRNTEWVVLDAWHRAKYAHDEALLRTEEEPVVRDWLARAKYGLVAVEDRYLVLRRGADVRVGLGARYLRGEGFPDDGARLTECLGLRGARLEGDVLWVSFVARGECPHDLALRLGDAWDPARVDLPFEGLLSPAKLARGDLVESPHPLSATEATAFRAGRLRLGAMRSSGARPSPEDPVSLPLREEGDVPPL